MFKPKKANRQKQRRRTSLEIEEEQSRTLYIRVPHTIKNVDEIKSLFFGDFRVKLPRQSSRYCHVIFNNADEKVKNMKEVKKKMIDGKPIFAGPPKPINLEKKKKSQHKKVKIPDPTVKSSTGKYLLISNIPPGVKASEVRDAFPGSKTIALLKGLVNGKRHAKLKMMSPQLCLNYIKDKDSWPVLKEQKVTVRLAKKTSTGKNKVKKGKKTESLKIYDGESDQKKEIKEKDESENANSAESEEDVSEEEDEDDVEEKEEAEEEEEEEDEETSSEEE